ncbi:hypothetical protein HFU84_01690 [Acidithiobacillus sp. CV18-2]|nr:hypothetical protein [Acidithiobacillus sp. CV18-3]MBU2758169.1 hypothetical protein [Acidithiobacillus sp. BN09-2]MBU2776249.1 hypothetical protein [Acidithiobacillus sp. CV18-2]MBU2799952.1 hypothetical protein [Acidithiobacillus sp. VAN18-4]
MKKAPNPEELNAITGTYFTTKKGRRAIGSLWNAVRILQGAKLTADDLSLIREGVADIEAIISGDRHG